MVAKEKLQQLYNTTKYNNANKNNSSNELNKIFYFVINQKYHLKHSIH